MEKRQQLVTYEQAKRLQDIGYNVPSTHGFYTKDKGEYITMQEYREDKEYRVILPSLLYASSVSDALQWIRDCKNVPCCVSFDYSDGFYYYGEYAICDKNKIDETATFDTHPLAESALLDEVLTFLEKK